MATPAPSPSTTPPAGSLPSPPPGPARPTPSAGASPSSPLPSASPSSGGGLSRVAQQAAAIAASSQGGSSATDRTGQVWMGGYYDHEHSVASEMAGQGRHYEEERWLTPDEAKNFVALMSPEEYQKLFTLAKIVTGSDHPSWQSVTSLWNQAVDRSASIRETTGRKISPFQIMEGMAKATADNNGTGGSSGGTRTSQSSSQSTSKSTNVTNYDTENKSVDLISLTDAQALAEGAFHEALGRKATDKELAAMRSFINKKERRNPSVTKEQGETRSESTTRRSESNKTTQTSDNAGNSPSSTVSNDTTNTETDNTGGTTTTTSGGVNEQQAAKNFAEQSGAPGEYEGYQMASKYLEALNRAILSPV